MHGLSYSHSRLCGCGKPASGHAGVSQRGPAINWGLHQIRN